MGISKDLDSRGVHGFLLQGSLDQATADRLASDYLADPIAQRTIAAPVGSAVLASPKTYGVSHGKLVHVLFKPGVMDPVAQSTLAMLRGLKYDVDEVRTFRKYWLCGSAETDASMLDRLCKKILSNDSIEHVVVGPLELDKLSLGAPYRLNIARVPIADLNDAELMHLSKTGQLYFSLPEMKTVQAHFAKLGRHPTDIELETIAQTWSEHCSHKTLGGRIEYRDGNGTRQFTSMLKETIFAATQKIRESLGNDDWCVSVFKDNAGVVTFDSEHHVVFKVETHNHPSAIEP
ncbi:MAG: phosphoribosylformylglycinamidine synthase, partial [Planctomycetes bacterium]|nr:phosphoribosylformylglycinamidine synthase [Planctomycetota bacterium]